MQRAFASFFFSLPIPLVTSANDGAHMQPNVKTHSYWFFVPGLSKQFDGEVKRERERERETPACRGKAGCGCGWLWRVPKAEARLRCEKRLSDDA
jgi:hypothetical protein